MRKINKLLISFFVFTLAFSAGFFVPPTLAESQVCGVDGISYASAAAADNTGVAVSYEGACQVVASESSLEEATEAINFAGVLIEIGTTEVPTTIIVQDNSDSDQYTVEVSATTAIRPVDLSNWIPGDQIRVIGDLNENTNTVAASSLRNLSFIARQYDGYNGWITAIDADAGTFTFTWNQQERTLRVTDRTRIVAGLKNPADIADLKIGDRLRGRVFENSDEAKIVVILRRGSNLFMKIRTFVPNAKLVRLSSTVVPTTIQVEIRPTPGLKANDVNNLVGTEGTLVTVNVTEDTILTRKYFGRTTLAEFSPGDSLRIVGRVNDDGTIDAKMIKNNSIWQVDVFGYAGTIQSINTNENYIEIAWRPIRYLPAKRLKEKLQSSAGAVSAQAVDDDADDDSRPRLRQLLQRLKDKAQTQLQQLRQRVAKRIKVDRISYPDIRLDDVIDRMPSRLMRVNITDRTVIRIGDNEQATIDDLSTGDRVIVRGVRNKSSNVIIAHKIVVFPSLPEIDDDLDTPLDDLNEVIEEIVTDVDSTANLTDTEVEIEE